MIMGMESLNLADTFVLFLALLGPQKVLLSVARLTRTLDARSIRVVVPSPPSPRRASASSAR